MFWREVLKSQGKSLDLKLLNRIPINSNQRDSLNSNDHEFHLPVISKSPRIHRRSKFKIVEEKTKDDKLSEPIMIQEEWVIKMEECKKESSIEYIKEFLLKFIGLHVRRKAITKRNPLPTRQVIKIIMKLTVRILYYYV